MNVIVGTNSSSKEIDVVNRFFIFRLFLFFFSFFLENSFCNGDVVRILVLLLFVDMTTETLSLSIFNLERKVFILLLLLRVLHIILCFFQMHLDLLFWPF